MVAFTATGISSPASAAPVLEAAVTNCYQAADGTQMLTVGVVVTGAEPNQNILAAPWILTEREYGLRLGSDVLRGVTDSAGSFSGTIDHPAAWVPLHVRAETYVWGSLEDGTEGWIFTWRSEYLPIAAVCPEVKPTAAVERLVSAGLLSEREAQSLLVKLGGAAAREEQGNVDGALGLLRAFINQTESLVLRGELTKSQAQSLIDAANAEIKRLGGTP